MVELTLGGLMAEQETVLWPSDFGLMAVPVSLKELPSMVLNRVAYERFQRGDDLRSLDGFPHEELAAEYG